MRARSLIPTVYIVFLMLPIYWLLNMSFKNTNEILGSFTLWPQTFTFANYEKIFTDPTWYMGYVNSLTYVVINTVLSVSVALPAAYAFSRYRFLGDKHLFFWLLTNRMAPPAVFALPFLQLYSAVGLFDTPWAVALAHTLFNIPLAVWILEGFMSGVPKELDETAYIDGYSFRRFFFRIFVPTIAAGIGVACFFCFMFSWVELLLAKTLTSVAAKPIAATMTRTASTSGYELGLLAAAGSLTLIPGAVVIYFVRNYIAKGFAMDVLVYDTHPNKIISEALGFCYGSFEEVLGRSDIITLHVPYNKYTHHLINKENIHKIKKGAILINTARGSVVDTEALLEALDKKILSGAGLDVLEGEELIKEEKQLLYDTKKLESLGKIVKDHILLSRENVVFTPHIAFYSQEALERILETTIHNILAFLSGTPQNVIRGEG